MMKNPMLAFVPLLAVGGAFAQVPPAGSLPGDVPAAQVQHRRSEVRQAVAAQPSGREPAGAGERRLTQQERDQLRQQIREHGRSGRNGDGDVKR